MLTVTAVARAVGLKTLQLDAADRPVSASRASFVISRLSTPCRPRARCATCRRVRRPDGQRQRHRQNDMFVPSAPAPRARRAAPRRDGAVRRLERQPHAGTSTNSTTVASISVSASTNGMRTVCPGARKPDGSVTMFSLVAETRICWKYFDSRKYESVSGVSGPVRRM